MSEKKVEIVKAIFRGWEEDGTEGMLRHFHEDMVYRPFDEIEAVRGHDAIREYFVRWMESWEDFTVKPTGFETAGDYVLNGAKLWARGRTSGAEVGMEYWQVWLFDESEVTQWEEYLDRGNARKAAGLPE